MTTAIETVRIGEDEIQAVRGPDGEGVRIRFSGRPGKVLSKLPGSPYECVYVLRLKNKRVKIGCTSNPYSRIKSLVLHQQAYGYPVTYIEVTERVSRHMELEKFLHESLTAKRHSHEVFNATVDEVRDALMLYRPRQVIDRSPPRDLWKDMSWIVMLQIIHARYGNAPAWFRMFCAFAIHMLQKSIVESPDLDSAIAIWVEFIENPADRSLLDKHKDAIEAWASGNTASTLGIVMDGISRFDAHSYMSWWNTLTVSDGSKNSCDSKLSLVPIR